MQSYRGRTVQFYTGRTVQFWISLTVASPTLTAMTDLDNEGKPKPEDDNLAWKVSSGSVVLWWVEGQIDA